MTPEDFKKKMWSYYHEHGRKFPWRETPDPYRIFVSEVMLQQTQTSRVLPKYTEFIDRFPDFSSLANASTAQVLSVWSGLGYNRRALYLKQAAEKIVDTYQGQIPQELHLVKQLPGIGVATASSILVFSFNLPLPFIETNIRRVYIHFFFPHSSSVSDAEIMPYVEKTLDRNNPREWYYALMDYGVHLAKTETNPNRRSSAYRRQSSFIGSIRRIRGAIIRSLVQSGGSISISDVPPIDTPDRIDMAIGALIQEKIIIRDGDTIKIA